MMTKQGFLEIHLFVGDYSMPVGGHTVLVKDERGNILHRLITDENGITERVALECPDKNGSADSSSNGIACFAAYDVEVPLAKGYKRVLIHGVQIFDNITSVLPVEMQPVTGDDFDENTIEIFIPFQHGVDLPKDQENGEITLPIPPNPPNPPDRTPATDAVPYANEVKIPDYITVHLGSPNASARNVRVPFKEYIKNVASSEIFPTWEESAIIANVHCQISFALNRIFT